MLHVPGMNSNRQKTVLKVDIKILGIAIKTFHELKATKFDHLWIDFGKRIF